MKGILLRGLGRVLPIAITLYILWSLFSKIDQILQPYILDLLGRKINGLGFVIVIAVIFIVGFPKGKFFSNQVDKFFGKVPIAKTIYTPVRDVVKTLTNKDVKTFKKVVEVEFPMKGIYSIGFVTNDSGDKDAIMIPTCPNISNGFLIYTNDYKELDINIEQGIKKVMSMGVLGE